MDVTDTLPLSVGLTKALKVTCTTAEGSVPSGSVSSGEATAIGFYLEKGDTHRLGVGTSQMSVSTLSFYAKASIATTYGISIGADQHATSQRVQIPFTISQANVYQRISVTIPTYNVALDSEADYTNGWNMHIVLDGVTSAIQTQLDNKQPLDAELTELATMSSDTAAALADLTQAEVQLVD